MTKHRTQEIADLQANHQQDNIEIVSEHNQPGCSGLSRVTTTNGRKDDCHKKKEIQAINQLEIKHDQRVLRKRLPSENATNVEEPAEGDDTDEDEGQEIHGRRIRLEPKNKRRKRDVVPKKEKFRDITEALQFYEGGVDAHGRKLYDITGDTIYLGEEVQMSANRWFLIQLNKPTILFRDMVELIWGRNKLINRCLDPAKVTTRLSDRSPIKALTPEKKRLSYKLYSDFLEAKKIPTKERMRLLRGVPGIFAKKINYLRNQYYE